MPSSLVPRWWNNDDEQTLAWSRCGVGSQEAGRRLLHYDSDICTVVVAVGQFWYLPLTVWRIGHCRCGLAGARADDAHGRQPRALTGTRCSVSSVTSAATFTAVQSLGRALELDPSDALSPLANILVAANAWVYDASGRRPGIAEGSQSPGARGGHGILFRRSPSRANVRSMRRCAVRPVSASWRRRPPSFE